MSNNGQDMAFEETPNKRRPFRRQQILDAAIDLFNEHGYHDTSMNDIGAAIGITGPGLYRHFPNKQSILETALLEAGEEMYGHITQIVESGLSPEELLTSLVDNYIDRILDMPALTYFVMAERRVLSDDVRAWVNRHMRLHAEEWVHALLQVRPELTDIEARVIVTGVFGLTHMIDRRWSSVDRDRFATLLKNVAHAALHADRPADPVAGSVAAHA